MYNVLLKVVDISTYTRKDIGNLAERAAAEYFRRQKYEVIARNVAFKTGELDIVVKKDSIIHILEVKASLCETFPISSDNLQQLAYDPGYNLHRYKIQKLIRTATWYVANIGWEGEWQIDAVLAWVRRKDGRIKIQHIPQIV